MPKRDNVEIFNQGQITPHRIHALLRLVSRRRNPSRAELLDFLQPEPLHPEDPKYKQSAAKLVFRAAVICDLIIHDESSKPDRVYLHHNLTGGAKAVEEMEDFRVIMQNRLCGVTDPDENNYLLNQVVSWYAVQDAEVISLKKSELAARFNDDLYPQETDSDAESGRAINDTKLNAWMNWAAFLGWGYKHDGILWPTAHRRLLPHLASPHLSLQRGKQMPFANFMAWLSELCPELDNGRLFDECWQASRPNQPRGQQLSLMLSTALRTLHELKMIQLHAGADATDRWRLHPAEGHSHQEVTHISILDKAHDPHRDAKSKVKRYAK